MARQPIIKQDSIDPDDLYASPYEVQTPDEDLWFLPGPSDDDFGTPFKAPDQRLLIDPSHWQKAESTLAPQLARAAAALATLDEHCRQLGPGAGERLALIEVEAMLWAQGTRLRREQIAAYLCGAGGACDARGDLTQSAWAYRRLLARPGPLPAMRAFLGLHDVGLSDLPETLSPRPKGAEFDLAADLFADGMAAMATCHPLTRAGYGLALWRLTGLSAPDDLLEPATAAARIAAQENRSLGFAPLAPGRGAWHLGAQVTRLAEWLTAIKAGAETATLELNRLNAWSTSARAATSGIKGSTPAKLINALSARPILTTEAAALLTGMSRDSAERGLARLLQMNVIHEITGGKRFRLWTAGYGGAYRTSDKR
ncbi:hypothetical protein [Pseudorhodobacter ferrugineus]|uniref:hypothetical protein n=1 Tax=Pseudorhodobacter ferrugineus TaxID=77008 RepID=UPI0003B4904A|nr:hypothetical protein [Pseudorhodobacter ferrugineus]